MGCQNHADYVVLLVSTTNDATVKVDIIHGLSGYGFSRLRLTALVGSKVLWTNRTAVAQIIQLNDQIIELAPNGKHAATALSRFTQSGQFVGRLHSNRAASITLVITSEFKL